LNTIVVAVTAAILALIPQWKSSAEKKRAKEYAHIIVEECEAVDPKIDPYLVVAMAFKESTFRAKIRGVRGEVGLMQILPKSTLTRTITKKKKSDLTDPRLNIRVGIGHLHYWQEQCGKDNMNLWLSAYNAGRCTSTNYAKRIRRVYCKINPSGCKKIS